MRKTTTILFCAVLLVTASAVAQPTGDGSPNRFRGPGGDGDGGKLGGPDMGCMIDFLELTDDQVAEWENIQAENREALREHMTEMRSIREEIHAVLNGGLPDATTLGNLMIESHELGQQARAAREAASDDFAALLTGEQPDKFELLNEFQNTCRGSGRGFGGGQGFGRRGGGGGFGGPPGS